MFKLVLIAVALAACGNKAADKPAPDCAPVIGGAIDRMLADAKSNAKLPPEKVAAVVEVAPKMKDAVTKVCNDDHWPAPALECLDAAKSQHEINECEHKITKEQRSHLETVRAAVLGSVVKPAGSAAVPETPTTQP